MYMLYIVLRICQRRRKLFRARDAISDLGVLQEITRSNLYGKITFLWSDNKNSGTPAPGAPLLPMPSYICGACTCVQLLQLLPCRYGDLYIYSIATHIRTYHNNYYIFKLQLIL